MSKLYLLRHAKSSWEDSRLEDFDRPLAPRGRKAAKRMGRWMRAEGIAPELVLLSPARRCRETWDLLAAELPAPGPEVRLLKSLYLAGPARLLARLRQAPEAVAELLLLLGHNPGLQGLAANLAGRASDPAALAELRQKFPTAALAVFEVEPAHWHLLAPGRARLAAFVSPRDLA